MKTVNNYVQGHRTPLKLFQGTPWNCFGGSCCPETVSGDTEPTYGACWLVVSRHKLKWHQANGRQYSNNSLEVNTGRILIIHGLLKAVRCVKLFVFYRIELEQTVYFLQIFEVDVWINAMLTAVAKNHQSFPPLFGMLPTSCVIHSGTLGNLRIWRKRHFLRLFNRTNGL